MSQRVESTRFPYLPLRIDLGSAVLELEALIDTGFDGALVLPAAAVPDGVSPLGVQLYGPADGSEARAPVYAGSVSVGELPAVRVEITVLGSEAILGRGVTDRSAVLLERGRRVVVEP